MLLRLKYGSLLPFAFAFDVLTFAFDVLTFAFGLVTFAFAFGFVPSNITPSARLTLFNVRDLLFMYLFFNPAFLILVWMFL